MMVLVKGVVEVDIDCEKRTMNDENWTLPDAGPNFIELILEPLIQCDSVVMKQAEGCYPYSTMIGCLVVLASPPVEQAATDL